MDREISKQEQSRSKLKKSIPILVVLGILALAYFGMRNTLKKTGKIADFHIVTVQKGNIKSTLSATGVIIPASERVINAPVSTEIQEVLLSTGTEVNPGDIILKLDQEYTNLEYEKLKDELSLRRNNIDKLKLEYDKNLRNLDYEDQIKALQLSELQTQLTDQKRLLEIGGATEEVVESAKLQLAIAQIEKKKLENELQYRRSVNETEKNNLQLEYNIQAKKLKELRRKLEETSVKSPDRGVITWINEDIGKAVAVGEPLVKIANLNRYKVEATTSDRNSDKLQIGLPVELRIGDDRLAGQVTRILPEVINNTIKFFIALDDDNHTALRPNLRAELYIITDNKAEVLRAKRGTGLKGTKSQYVYKVVDNEAIKTRITKGLVSTEYFEIAKGLQQGDKIIISETKEYDHMDRFELKED